MVLAEINIHARGLAVQARQEFHSLVGSRVRAVVGSDEVLPYRGQLIVPIEYAHLLASAFDESEIAWSADVWSAVQAQRTLHAQIAAARIEVAEAISDPLRNLDGYPLLSMLDDHQLQAVAAMSVPSLVGLAIFDEQGLGKTIMALCAFDRLVQLAAIERLVVVAPKSVLPSWRDDAHKALGDRYVVRLVGGTAHSRSRQIRSKFQILLCSYEMVAAEVNLLSRVIRNSPDRFMLVVDESYYVKNPDAIRSQAVAEVRGHCDRAIVLCGTPAPNSPRDLMNQIDIVYDGATRAVRSSPEDDALLRDYASRTLDNLVYLRRLKEDALPDLPTKNIERIFIDLQPRQRELYDAAVRNLVLEVRGVDDQTFQRNLASFLARRLVLLQICSHPGSLDTLYDETPAKVLALDHLLRQLVVVESKKVVVWSYFRHSLEVIAQRYGEYGLVRIDGTITSVDERQRAIRQFQDDAGIRVFLGNAAAAGAGITLTAAHHAIYESFSNQAAQYMQSVDRIHRRGQQHEVSYHVLLAQNTIEMAEFDRILAKERSARDLLGDIYQEPITRQRFLAGFGLQIDGD